MNEIPFPRDAGDRVFDAAAIEHIVAAVRVAPDDDGARLHLRALCAQAVDALEARVESFGFKVDRLSMHLCGTSGQLVLEGAVADTATAERLVLLCGNVAGVASVQTRLDIGLPGTASKFVTVQRGDTLSTIARTCCGDGLTFLDLFEANRPLLARPDRLYPGQTLRVPC